MVAKKTLQDRIKGIINKYDPIGLLKLGSPDSEYTPESKRIIARCGNCTSVSDLNQKIYEIFVEMFEYGTRRKDNKRIHADPGGAGKLERYKGIAEEIFPLLKK